jgi:hypothetical protein
VGDTYAVTDVGRRVPLYTLPDEDETELGARVADTTLVRGRLARLIRTAEPDVTHNCHGWVFTAGQRWLRGRDVDVILEDNGYQKVTAPRVGDIVIYRSQAGSVVLHTGLVRSAEPGLILIESKWGALGRYVHRAEDQCYGDNFAYYHTERQGHALLGLGTTAPAARCRP